MLSSCPDAYGLVLTCDGYVSIKELQRAVVHENGFGYVTPALLTQFLLINSQHYEISGNMVRCRDGCVISPLLVESPPNILYLAISLKNYDMVKKNGLRGGSNRVVLFVTEELAVSVVKRRFSSYVLLQIKTDIARGLGCCFYLYGESIYLSDQIPLNAIVFPPLSVVGKCDSSVLNRRPVHSVKKGKKDGVISESGGFFLSVIPPVDLKSVKKRGANDSIRDPDWKIARRSSRRRGGF